ncbi:hypothetical protein IOD14_23580 [Streptomyces sp. A2-16]|uniref:hypothetical protein n=1 Tax=Streptomyces sp. A2-16 TaxID=2781734 RepID=UPI001BAFD3CC|nr:hypothetical protein [Streptomyces sp. A2-16]QUC59489.1 hypothetical protein IOD14_23580 [Streptomyces sp. A2-16]
MSAGDAEDDGVVDDGGVRMRDGGQGHASADVPVPGDVGGLAGEGEGQVGGAVGFDAMFSSVPPAAKSKWATTRGRDTTGSSPEAGAGA